MTPPPASRPDDDSKLQLALELSHRSGMQAWEATLEAGEGAIKSALLINGGAAVALLAFLGNVAGKDVHAVKVSIGGMRWALEIFAGGVACAALALVARHLATFSAGHVLTDQAEAELGSGEEERRARSRMEGWMKVDAVATIATVLFELASLGAFVWGGLKAAGAVW